MNKQSASTALEESPSSRAAASPHNELLMRFPLSGQLISISPDMRFQRTGIFIVLEVLKEEKELGVIAAENNLNPNMVRKWRKEFLENAESVFENPTQIEKDFQRKEDDLKKKQDKMLKTIGQLTLERDFLQDCFRKSGIPIPDTDK